MKIKIPKAKSLKKELDELWARVVKARAGYKSELSGELGRQAGGDVILVSHHIFGKSNNRLRFDLQNGICLNNYKEHIWGVHNKNNPNLAYTYHQLILEHIGKKRSEYLKTLLFFKNKTDLKLVKILLEQELKKSKEK